MKKDLYDVVFGLEHEEIFAISITDAAILAVAIRIQEGKSTTIDQIYDIERDEFVVLIPCKLQLLENE